MSKVANNTDEIIGPKGVYKHWDLEGMIQFQLSHSAIILYFRIFKILISIFLSYHLLSCVI